MITYRKLLPLSLKSLLIHKLRSFLSVLGVICGVMAVMSMISIGEGAKDKVLKDIESLGLTNIYINKINLTAKQKEEAQARHSPGVSWQDVGRLRQLTEYIRGVAAMREITRSLVTSHASVTPKIVQVTPNYFALAGIGLASGRLLLPIDEQENNPVCVLGADVAVQLGKDGRVGSSLRVGGTLYTVVGILAEQSIIKDDSGKISPDNYNQTLFLPFPGQEVALSGNSSSSSENLSRVLVEVLHGKEVAKANILIDRTLEITHNGVRDFQVVVPQELLQQSLKTQKLFNIVLAMIGGISLFVGGIGIMNIMLATVSERKQEIGLRRAVGATARDILWQFLAEAIMLTVIGGFLGIFLGTLVIFLAERTTGWPMHVTVWAMLAPFFLSIITGICSGIYPANQAAHMDPIQALRSV